MAKPLAWLGPAVVTGGLVPVVSLGVRAATGTLGANGIAVALNQLGLVALVLLLATLACTPAKVACGWTWPLRLRRTLGLLSFGYASTHLFTWAVLDLGLDFLRLGEELVKRPFITVGFLAWLGLVPLALTSTDASVRRLGFGRWKALHRLAYLSAALGVVHFAWRVKKSLTEPLVYALVLGALLLFRGLTRFVRGSGRRA